MNEWRRKLDEKAKIRRRRAKRKRMLGEQFLHEFRVLRMLGKLTPESLDEICLKYLGHKAFSSQPSKRERKAKRT